MIRPVVIVFLAVIPLLAAGKTWTVVLYENPPLIILEEGEAPRGIVPEFFESLELGRSELSFGFRTASFPEAMRLIREGEADILPAVAMTYDRQREMRFSKEELIRNRAVVYRRSDVPFHEVEDLNGKSVALLRDDVHAEAFRELVGIYGLVFDPVEVDRYPDAVRLLRRGDVDLAVLNEIFAGTLGGDRELVSTFLGFNPIDIRIGYRADIPASLVARIDEELRAQHERSDSPLNRAIFRYLSPSSRIFVPPAVWWLLGALAVLLSGIAMFNRVLRKKIARRTEELRAERDRAAAADRAKAHFLGNISHEIRTPLNGILGFCQLLESSRELGADDRECVTAITESSHRLETVLEAILRYSTLASEPPVAASEEVDLDAVVHEVVDVVRVRFDLPAERFRTETGADAEGVFRTDRNSWYLILEGLLTNAAKYGKGSPVSVRLSAEPMSGTERVRLRLEVEDRGEGIPAEARERVFLPFEQVDGSLSRPHEGVGLGLSLVKIQVDVLGGTIRMESPERGGFRVIVDAPVNRGGTPPTSGRSR